MVDRTTPYIHTYRKEHPLSQLLIRLEQRIKPARKPGFFTIGGNKRNGTHSDISFDNGSWTGSEGSNGRRKGTPAVYGVTADIGVNLCGVVGDSGVSGTALRTSNASVNHL